MLSKRNHKQKSTHMWFNLKYKTGKTNLQSYKSRKYWQWPEKNEEDSEELAVVNFVTWEPLNKGEFNLGKFIHLNTYVCFPVWNYTSIKGFV